MDVSEPIGVRAARLLDARRRNIQYRWIQRVVTGEPYSLRPNLPLPAVLGQVSALLDGLSMALRSGFQARPGNHREEILRQEVRRHAELRASQGFRPEELIAEFRALRCEVWHTLEKGLQEQDEIRLSEVFALQATLDYAIDTLILGTVAAWHEVEQRGRA